MQTSVIAESLRLRTMFSLKALPPAPLPSYIRSATLQNSLDACIQSRSLIKEEQSKILPLIAEASGDIERGARQYQYDLIEWQLIRASDIAGERLAYFDELTDFKAEQEKCKSDMLHWFKYYAWGYDPRADSSLAVMPLEPFDFQKNYLAWLDDLVFTRRSSGVAKKPRDVGWTVFALAWCVYHWLYTPHFAPMLASATEDLVDSKQDSDTLFEKVRFILRLLPEWMLPKGFNLERDLFYMSIANPENGSLITGTAPTAKVGRQRRRTVVICDEFQAWPYGGFPQHQALSQTAKSLVAIGTPEGRFNKYADLVHDNVTARFEIDWREHPWKDERWYNSLPFGILCPAMTPEDIAQEIDQSFDASQPGKVIKNCQEEYCFITWDELVAGFEAYNLGHHFKSPDGRFKIPDEWNWGRISDYGESARAENDTHIWAYCILGRPQQAFPFTDSIFFFAALPIMPIGATELEGFAFYSQIERDLGVRGSKAFYRSPTLNDMSHEATDPKEVLRDKCGDNWNIPDLDFDKGRRKLVFHFAVVDKHLQNPFRPQLMGRSRIYFVAPNSEYFMAKNERAGTYFVTPSQTQRGFKRLRAEIPSWHYPPEERGKPVPKMRPKAIFDDVITTVRYALARWGVTSAPLNEAQKVEKALPVPLKSITIAAEINPMKKAKLLMAQQIKIKGIQKQMNRLKTRNVMSHYRQFTQGK